MPSLVLHVDTAFAGNPGRVIEVLELRRPDRTYTLSPGVPTYIDPADLPAIQAAISSTGGSLANAPVCTLVITGGAAGSFSYQIVPFNDQGDDAPPTATSTAVGPTTLDGTHFIDVNWTGIANADGYKVRRVTGGPSQGLIATLGSSATTFRDNGAAASVFSPSASNPANWGWRIQGEV
jgi:hypothetical protein